jgi:putative oxidoreductase
MVGAVFLSEGIQKFLYPDSVGSGRFEKIGLPMPELLAPAVGLTEIICGALVLAGWRLRHSVLPLLAVMIGALVSTKFPILVNQGFWKMAHETRTDFSMVMGLLFLLFTNRSRR